MRFEGMQIEKSPEEFIEKEIRKLMKVREIIVEVMRGGTLNPLR